ncbi:MAG: hypothetical protein ACYDA4_14525 [Ignavibacteriaceae bacterium]
MKRESRNIITGQLTFTIEGSRIKHPMKDVSIKMYDKFSNNDRFEMGFKIITELAVIEYNNLREPTLTIKKEGHPLEALRVENKNAYSEQMSYFGECVSNKANPERIRTLDAIKSLTLSLRIKSLIESSIE